MKKKLFLAVLLSLLSLPFYAQENLPQKDAASVTKDANNPLASIKSFSMHNVYTSSLYSAEGTLNTFWLRYAQPIGRVLIRASLAVNNFNIGEIDRSGLGDLNVFGTYILTQPTSANQLGVGPIFTIPTATSSLLGAGKWQVGAAFVGYFASNPVFQSGVLATWQHSFAGDKDRNKVQIATVQPFLMWQLGKGVYLRSTGIAVLDLENGNYLVPLGLGAGKVIKAGNLVFNLFAEPQFTVWHKGEMMPKVQCFIGINTQF